MTIQIHTLIRSSYTGRIRVRQVSSHIDDLAAKARDTGRPRMRCSHGGAVPNSYGYPASTEASVEVVFPPRADGVQLAIRYLAQIRANKATLSGAASAAAGRHAAPLWDGRFGEAALAAARRQLVRTARADIGYLAGGEVARRKREQRARRIAMPYPAHPLHFRFCRLLLSRSGAVIDRGELRAVPRWLEVRREYWQQWRPVCYRPAGDDRDVAAFRLETNQERRRQIYAACGERVLDLDAMTLLHEDEYGQLYDTHLELAWGQSIRYVRVTCPSTGAVYLLPCSPSARTAHEAVASTFGLRSDEYRPIAQS